MNSLLSVQQVLDVVSPTFRSVDVRSLTFIIDNAECNVVTAVNFNEQPATVVESTIETLIKANHGFGDARLQFHFKVVPCEQLHELIEELKTGILAFAGGPVKLMRPVNILESKGYIDSFNFLRRRQDWPVFESHLTWTAIPTDQTMAAQKLQWVQQDPDLRRNLNANGYRSLGDVLRIFADSRPDNNPSYESDVYIAVPVFATLRGLRFNPTEHRLFAAFDCHPSLRTGIRAFGDHILGPMETGRIIFSIPEQSNGESWAVSAPLNLDDKTVAIEVFLSHSELGFINSRSVTPIELLPPEEINPLWHLLQVFCPSSTIEVLLTMPPKPKDKRQKEQRYFEQHIAWLLALHGFSVAVLGEFESLRTPGSSVEQGSLDILAHHKARNKVLMCSCTLTPPEERDYGNLVSVRTHLLARLNRDVSFRTELAIFSSAAECVAPRHYRSAGTYVAIFDGRDLKKAIENLNMGKEGDFFDRLDGTFYGGDWAGEFPSVNAFDLG